MSLLPDRRSVPSTIGLFILNFSTLDLWVQNYLEDNVPAEEFAQLKNRTFKERIERIRKQVQEPDFDPKKRDEFERWAARFKPIREIRNHIAHGVLRMEWDEDPTKWRLTISLPRDLDNTHSPDAVHLSFAELVKAEKELRALSEEFDKWTGAWVTDWEGVIEKPKPKEPES